MTRASGELGQKCPFRRPSLIQPNVFKPPAVVDAVDHDIEALHIGMPARRCARVKDNRAGNVLGQFSFDLPHQFSPRRQTQACGSWD